MSVRALLPGPQPSRQRHPIAPSAHAAHPAGPTEHVASGFRRRGVAIGVAFGVVVVGILYFFFYDPLFRHSSTWADPSDLWGMFRASHYVGWGFLGGIYNQETGMVTFPGIAVLLAPIAMLADLFHLSAPIEYFRIAHPSAAPLLVPIVLLLASTVVVAADALADELGVGAARRAIVALLVGAMAWAATIIWGHPEDALVMTFGCLAMVAVLRDNWRRAGWLFGIAIVFQPLIALAIPLFFAATPRGQRLLFAVRCSIFSAFLVGVCFLGNPSGAFRALIKQPTPPYVNHATPWVTVAPHVALSGAGQVTAGARMARSASGAYLQVNGSSHALLEVAAGPGRTFYVVLALLAGLYAWRRPQDPVRLVWLAGVVLGARCFFEAVMTPYYLTPPLILLLVLAASRGAWRFAASVVVAAGISWFAYWHFAPWVWWPPIVAGMTVVMALSRPAAPSTVEHGDGGEHSEGAPDGNGDVERTAPVDSSERGTSTELEPVA
jgi:hypothetical protein